MSAAMRLNALSWLVLFCSALVAEAQAPTNGPVRQMSLNDCIRMALERNLSIQIGDRVALGDTADLDVRSGGRIGLEDTRLQLEDAYGYYDPVVAGRAGQNFEARTGGTDPTTGLALPGEDQWTENFRLGVAGYLPTGARYELASAMSRLSGGEHLDTDPLSPTFGLRVADSWEYRSQAAITVTQPLLKNFWTDQGRTEIKLRKNAIRRSEWAFRLLVMDIVKRVADAYYDLLAARDQIRVQAKALELAQQLVAENRKKVEVGTLAPLDERQAEAQAATAKSDLTAAIFASQEAENLLKALISHEFTGIQPTTIEPTEKLVAVFQALNLAESWRTGLEQRPDYLLAKQELENRDIALVFRKNQLYPQLDVVGTYGRSGLGGSTADSWETIDDNRFPNWGGAIILSFPLTSKSERSAYKSAKLAKQASILGLKRVEDSILQEIDIALKAVKSAYDATESSRQARIYAEEALSAEQKKLENGKSTSFQVLQFQRDLTDASSKEIRALSAYNKALHNLYFREGTTLDRNKVTLELK